MMDQTLHTFDPHNHPTLPRYDLQAAALIIVTLKLFFCLDDMTEWYVSSTPSDDLRQGFRCADCDWFYLSGICPMTLDDRRTQVRFLCIKKIIWHRCEELFDNMIGLIINGRLHVFVNDCIRMTDYVWPWNFSALLTFDRDPF